MQFLQDQVQKSSDRQHRDQLGAERLTELKVTLYTPFSDVNYYYNRRVLFHALDVEVIHLVGTLVNLGQCTWGLK